MKNNQQDNEFKELMFKAHQAGRNAVANLTVRPMVVGQAKDLFSNEIDYSQPVHYVADGPCGFAWVSFKGNTPFGRWAKKEGVAKPGYPTGLQIWIGDYNQSMQKKSAHADAMAKVLRDAGIAAYANERMD